MLCVDLLPLVSLISALLVTDILGYKPLIIFQGPIYATAFLLVLVGLGVHLAQLAFFSYSTAVAADVAYFSCIVQLSSENDHFTAAVVLGSAVGAGMA